MRAGFAEVDITPVRFPIRTYLSKVDGILDPIYAKAAVFDDGSGMFGFVSLDVVIVEAEYARQIQELASSKCGLPSGRIMVCTTHNHACPAVVDRPTNPKEHEYIKQMIASAAEAVVLAFKRLEEVGTASGSGLEARVAFNRRFIKRDGTVVTHPGKNDLADVLCNEGVIDPEVGVLAVRNASGELRGALVNFGCHAVHHMGEISAGYPGVLSQQLKEKYGAGFVCVFLNGPCGNIHHMNHLDPYGDFSKEAGGARLAQTVVSVMDSLSFTQGQTLSATGKTVRIKYRPLDELIGKLARPETLINVLGVTRELGFFEYSLELLRKLHARSDGEDAMVQAVRIGDAVFASIPAEYFMEHGLRIKRMSTLRKTYVVSLANGWLGYIATREALSRNGGHETTQAFWSKMEPDAGDILADHALSLIKEVTR